MEGANFADFIARERERLHGEREQIFNQQQELETKLAAIDNEMRAIDAYEAAKTGKPLAPPQTRGGGRRATRRGSRRESILRVIRENPAGLSRGELLEKMGLKGRKSGEMSRQQRSNRSDESGAGSPAGWEISGRGIGALK